MAVAEVQKIADDFMRDYNGHIPLQVTVANQQEDIYGSHNSVERSGKIIKGGYHAKSGKLVLVAANLQGELDARETIRHEVLGHYGLNTFSAGDKLHLLATIIHSKNNRFINQEFQRVQKKYKELANDEFKQAEEVFAAIAEQQPTELSDFLDGISAVIAKLLRNIGLLRGTITKVELRNIIRSIAKGIRNGQRTQQTFPVSDEAQFSKDNALLAPNGKPSNLNALQHAQVRTPEFKAWFGDWENDPENASKVVDENGEPLVVYHGSSSGHNGAVFNKGYSGIFFSSNKKVAESYLREYRHNEEDAYFNKKDLEEYPHLKDETTLLSNQFFDVFLNIKNPKMKDYNGENWLNNPIEIHFDKKNNDGFIAKNIIDGNSTIATTYVVFEPNQIKSATANTGAFSTDNNDIRYSQTKQTSNPHTQSSLSQALRTTLDKAFGNGFFSRLLATGKFKVIDRTQAAAFGANPNAQAFFNPKDDTTYFVADNIGKGTNLVKLALHELGVHALQMGKDSAAFQAILRQVENLINQRNPSPAVKAAIKAAKDANTPAHLFLEEVAGYLVEFHPDLSVSQKIITWLKAQLRKLGVRVALNEADIVSMATAALRTAPDSLLFAGDVRGGIRNSKGQLLAPNGKPSNLNALQHAQVRTPEFKAWFGDWENDPENASKVVDENGEPLVVYHGSHADFTEFLPEKLGSLTKAKSAYQGFFFASNPLTTDTYTAAYADTNKAKGDMMKLIESIAPLKKEKASLPSWTLLYGNKIDKDGNPVMRRFSDLKEKKRLLDAKKSASELDAKINPIRREIDLLEKLIREPWSLIGTEIYDKYLGGTGSIYPVFLAIKNPFIYDFNESRYRDVTYNELLINAKNNKHDGGIFKNTYDGGGTVLDMPKTDIFIALNPSQIKSATANTGAFSTDNNDIRYSLRSHATDFFTEEPRRARTLADRYNMLDTGKQPNEKIGWQYYFDKAVTTFTDSTRPFARFVQDTFDAEHASALLSGADRALGMKAAYEKEAMGLFGNRVAKGVRDIEKVLKEKYPKLSRRERYKTAKDIAGDWMTVRYAPDANAWLMQKDQDAIDALNNEIAAVTDPEELKTLNKKLVKAQAEQAARIAAINDPAIIDPTNTKQEAGLAGGFNNATAADYQARIEALIPKALLEATAKPIYEMNAWKLKRDIQDGKISQATADKFPKYAHYVPLTGDPRTDDSVDDHFATGSVNQAKDKALGGRTGSIAQNGIDASFEQLEKSARYHGWNDFKTALTNTYDDLIAEKMATGLTPKQAQQAVWDEHHLKRRAETGMIAAGENDITVRKDGKGFIYTVNNQGAMEALRSVNDEPTPSILKPIAALTRLQARMVTQFMPLFAPTNMIRDVAERSENIRTRKIVGHETLDMNMIARQAIGNAGGLLLHIKPIMAGVLAENTHLAKLFPVDNANADVIMLNRFLALGGSSTYGDMMSGDSQSLAEKLRKSGTLSREAMDVVELWNNAFETISGFSIYKALVKNGVSDEKAATASLNLMNFRKRGKVMSPIRALYMFAQPIATGGHQMAMTLSTPRGKVRFAAYTVASMFLYAMLRSGDDDDELGVNRMDEQGNFTLYRNILIPMGSGRYIKVPVGFGMQQLAWAHGVNNIRMMLGEMTAAEGFAESQALWARSAMPVAPAETAMWKNPTVWFAQTFTPQIAKPIVNIGLDRNAFGAPLTNARYEQQDKARSLQGRRDTPKIYKDVAQFFARNGVDMYPEQLREIARGYGAGAGNEVLKWAVENPAKEARGLNTVSPLIDRYVLQSNDDSLKQRLYFRLRDRMNEINARESTGGTLTPEEKRLADLGDRLKRKEAQQRGKVAAATKAERAGQAEKAANLRAMADRMRVEYMNYALTQRR